MEYRIEITPAFRLIGVKGRTSNAAEMSGAGVIAGLWEEFGRLAGQIPEPRSPGRPIAVYTDYDTDETGAYMLYVGFESRFDGPLPEGLHVIDVPLTRSAVMQSDKGHVPDIVIAAWQAIWADEGLKGRRAFTYDIEVYAPAAEGEAVVEVRLALR